VVDVYSTTRRPNVVEGVYGGMRSTGKGGKRDHGRTFGAGHSKNKIGSVA